MKLRTLGARDLRRAMPMEDTIEAMKNAFSAFSSGAATVPQRLAVAVPPDDGVLLVKPALLPGEALGAKLVSVFPQNAAHGRPVVSGLVVIFDELTGEPAGLCDGGFLTAWRTGAAAGAATDLLAGADASIGAIIGCGVQGRTQAVAVDTVRRFEEIRIFDTRPEQVVLFATEMADEISARIVPSSSPAEAVDDAHVICTATTATEPVIHGAWLGDGSHLNGVGSFTPAMCEVDGVTISRARIFVDSRAAAAAEAGELIRALADGITKVDDWTELGEVVNGSREGRRPGERISFFKSVGLAVQDMAAAALAFRRAGELGLGAEIELD